MKSIFPAIIISSLLTLSASAQLFNFSTFAGSGGALNNPIGAATDASGNIFVANADDDTILKISPAGTVSVLAGSPGIAGSADGTGTNALFNAPQGVAVDATGNIFVADSGNSTIRKITASGTVTTLAGTPGVSGSADGTNAAAQFFSPQGIVADSIGNLFVADTFNHAIRQISASGVVTTLAGLPGFSGSADGMKKGARFNRPTGIALDQSGNLLVTDLFNHTIRKITPAGIVSTVAGLAGVFGSADGTNGAAQFFMPAGLTFDGTNFFVADSGNHAIRQLSPMGTNWVVSTIAGWSGNAGNVDGSGIAARFFYPAGLTWGTNGNLFVADAGNDLIRRGRMITNDPPVILSQPQNQTANLGDSVTFSVVASNASSLYYQWQWNGENIPGATGSSFSLVNAQATDAGNYSVIVTSPAGSVVSSDATLTVYAPPTITSQPVSQACLQGSTVSFSVLAGSPPLTYQWQKNGHNLFNSTSVSGATAATLTLSNVTAADNASYSVVVSNGHGLVSSVPATLTIFLVPSPDSIQPVAWWLLNEGSGTTAFDYSGNGHNGALNSGATWTAGGHAGNGIYFNGTNTASIGINSSFLVSGDWTAAMWVNRWGLKSSSVLVGGSHYALKLEQGSSTNRTGYTYYGHTDYVLNYSAPQNTWTYLTFVKTTAGISVYANGVLMATNKTAASLDATALGLGYPTVTTDNLDATLNDVRLYTNALTAPQIANLFTYGRITPIPQVTLAAPTNGASFIVSTNINVTANVVSNSQSLVRVEFYNGTNLLGQAAAPPYVWTWTNVSAGDDLLVARAIFNGTNVVNSSPVEIYIAPATNQVNLTFTADTATLQLFWPPDHTGWRLQMQTNSVSVGLSTNWTDVPNAMTTNQVVVPVNPANGSVFYRLIYP